MSHPARAEWFVNMIKYICGVKKNSNDLLLQLNKPNSTITCFQEVRRYTAPFGTVTFRQSPCWYYPRSDEAVSTSVDTKHLWARWHFGNHLVDIIPGRMKLSQHPSIQSTCGHGDISVITLLILSPVGWSCLNIHRYTAPVGTVTFRQSPCWYYPRSDEAVSASAYTQHLWARWHFGNHLVDIIPGRMKLSQHPPIHSTCGHDDIPLITPILSMYLSTTSAVFTRAGHVNILHEWVLHIPQSSSITGAAPSDCSVSYSWHTLLRGYYPSAEKQSVYSTTPAHYASSSL